MKYIIWHDTLHDTDLRMYQIQYINVFQVFFPFYLMISWHLKKKKKIDFDDNFLYDSVPLLHNIALRQQKIFFGGGG